MPLVFECDLEMSLIPKELGLKSEKFRKVEKGLCGNMSGCVVRKKKITFLILENVSKMLSYSKDI